MQSDFQHESYLLMMLDWRGRLQMLQNAKDVLYYTVLCYNETNEIM